MLFELIITAHVIIEEKYKRYFCFCDKIMSEGRTKRR